MFLRTIKLVSNGCKKGLALNGMTSNPRRYVQLWDNRIMTLKNFNWVIFLVTFFVTGLLIMPSLLAAHAELEGVLRPDHTIWNFLAIFFKVLQFPTHILFEPLIIAGGQPAFLGGLFVNCMFYGLVFERFTFLLSKPKKGQSD